MCGDPFCPSCGVAMGNARCPHCGAWSAEGGCPDPAACELADAAYAEAMAAQMAEEDRLAREWLADDRR